MRIVEIHVLAKPKMLAALFLEGGAQAACSGFCGGAFLVAFLWPGLGCLDGFDEYSPLGGCWEDASQVGGC